MTRRSIVQRIQFVATGLALSSPAALAHSQPTFTERSYAQARAILDRGIAALGGEQRVQAIEDIQFTSTARIPEVGQSASPQAPLYIRPQDSEGVIDLAHRRYAIVRTTNYIGSGPRPYSIVVTEKGGFTEDLRSNAVYPLAPPAATGYYRSAQRAFPALLLQLATARPATLRWIGQATVASATQNVVSFVDPDGSFYTLFFDATTGLLTRTESLLDGFLDGLTTGETDYSDYRAVGGVLMPFHVVSRSGSALQQDLAYREIAVNTRPSSTRFDMPASAELGPHVGGPPQPITVTKLGRDVYFVDPIETGGIFFYSSLFVVFNDYVLVLESPLSTGVSRAIIDKITAMAPGKPIRYLALTHYHTDHSGGLRAYIAEGSTIVTTPGNRQFVEDVAGTVHPLNPDVLSKQRRAVSIETFSGKRVFSDGDHVVELYSIGPTPHVDEMVMAYIPAERLAFVSDLFLVSYKGRNGPAEATTRYFYDTIRALGLDVRTIASGHGRIGTMDELRQSIAEAR